MPHRIRSAVGSDASAIVDLLDQLGYPDSVEAVERRLARLATSSGIHVLVAEGAEVVLGLATFHLIPVLHEERPRGQLTALVVADSARGAGIGRSLVRHVEQLAVAAGVSRLVVTTANHREDTHRFYERLGYEWTGRRYGKSLPGAAGR